MPLVIKQTLRALLAIIIILPVIVSILFTLQHGWRTIALALVPLALALRFGSRVFHKIHSLFDRLSRRRALAIAVVGLFAFAASATLTVWKGVRDPEVTDEFSYLLAADTFAHGRLTNPPHPMWVYLEAVHVIHQPTYASKYPPGQGLILAAGLITGGHAIVGVWLSMAMAASALCWMLMAWVPRRWATMGGMMIIFHPMFLEWSQSYWGGAVALCGGAIAAGAFRRLLKKPRAREAILMGAGILLLANTRPFEGAILSLCLGAWLAVWMAGRKGPTVRVAIVRVVMPLGAMLALTLLWTGFYNWRVTGDPLRFPYSVHEDAYGIAPLFLFQNLRPEPNYNHKALRDLHSGWELTDYLNQQTTDGVITGIKVKLRNFLDWNLQSLAFLIPLLMLPCALRDRWTRGAMIVILICVTAIFLETWLLPHYASLLVGMSFVVVMRAMRRLRALRWGKARAGIHITRATIILAAALTLASWINHPAADRDQWYSERARMTEGMRASRERHLVIVRYGSEHLIHQEWVHNEADIDNSAVVWARDMKDNQPLLEYFSNRRVWLLEVNAGHAALRPFQ
ncbi:MAG: hypothetical protein AB1631_10760 [Acidobacteriota bacterium]